MCRLSCGVTTTWVKVWTAVKPPGECWKNCILSWWQIRQVFFVQNVDCAVFKDWLWNVLSYPHELAFRIRILSSPLYWGTNNVYIYFVEGGTTMIYLAMLQRHFSCPMGLMEVTSWETVMRDQVALHFLSGELWVCLWHYYSSCKKYTVALLSLTDDHFMSQ